MDEAEASADYARRSSDERKLAFGHALADLCNQWSMSFNRGWVTISAQRHGYKTVATGFDCDGDVSFSELPEDK